MGIFAEVDPLVDAIFEALKKQEGDKDEKACAAIRAGKLAEAILNSTDHKLGDRYFSDAKTVSAPE